MYLITGEASFLHATKFVSLVGQWSCLAPIHDELNRTKKKGCPVVRKDSRHLFHSFYSRRIVGWAMSPRQTLTVVAEAWWMAWQRRRSAPGLIHHSDQGNQYRAGLYQQLLTHRGVVPSMSRKGNCYDNAPVESFFSSLKNELIHHQRFAHHADARYAIAEYIEVFYNRQRLHQAHGYRSPEEFEQQASAA